MSKGILTIWLQIKLASMMQGKSHEVIKNLPVMFRLYVITRFNSL